MPTRDASRLRSLTDSRAVDARSLHANRDLSDSIRGELARVDSNARPPTDADRDGGRDGDVNVDVDVNIENTNKNKQKNKYGDDDCYYGYDYGDCFWWNLGFASLNAYFCAYPYHGYWYNCYPSPYFRSNFWYHYGFGYYPAYYQYCYPYISYVASPAYVEVPIYVPVYPDTAPAVPAAATEIPPDLANELRNLEGNASAVAWLESGANSFKTGDYTAAVDAFRKAMLAEPNNAVPKFAMAHALFALGEYEYAVFLIRRGMQILPGWPLVGTSLHELYGTTESLAEQIIALRVFADTNPEERLMAVTQRNALAQLDNLRTYPCVAAALAEKRLTLHAWVYRFEVGEVLAYSEARQSFVPLTADAPAEVQA